MATFWDVRPSVAPIGAWVAITVFVIETGLKAELWANAIVWSAATKRESLRILWLSVHSYSCWVIDYIASFAFWKTLLIVDYYHIFWTIAKTIIRNVHNTWTLVNPYSCIWNIQEGIHIDHNILCQIIYLQSIFNISDNVPHDLSLIVKYHWDSC